MHITVPTEISTLSLHDALPIYHELHRRVIVVQQQHAVEIGPLGLRLGLGDDRGARRARPSPFAVVVIALTRGTRSVCEIGRASCREGVEIAVVCEALRESEFVG